MTASAAETAESSRTWPWRWFVAQAGSREYYAVPRSVHMTSRLGMLYTGSWCKYGRSLLQRGPTFMWSYAGHWHEDLPSDKVKSFDLGYMAWMVDRALITRPKTIDASYKWECDNSRWFALRTWRELRKVKLDPAKDCFFGFMSECMEVLQPLADTGVPSILDLAGPGKMDDRMIKQEHERWPDWAKMGPDVPEFYYERVAEECRCATLTLVNSEFSRRAWIEQGVPDEKIIVVPLAYEPPDNPAAPRRPHDRPLTILWLGSVILRKGIPYLVEAARSLRDANVKFIVAGPIRIAERIVQAAPKNMQFVGRINNDQKAELYRQSDVFVIPTMSDGFAITQLEAMAQGMPVIATPNCGDVVTHGDDGLIVPAGDAAVLAQAIAKLEGDRALVASMSERALIKSRQFSVRRFGELVNSARDRITAGETKGSRDQGIQGSRDRGLDASRHAAAGTASTPAS
jgi:glycosyltransferase involved in cell wall biosynthesis